MESPLRPTVTKILEELQARPRGMKRMSARRVLRAFGYERRSRENVREICEQFQRANIDLTLSLSQPASLDEQIILTLREAVRRSLEPAQSSPPVLSNGAGLPHPGHLARGCHGSVADIIAAVRRCTVQVFTEEGGGSGVIVDPDGLILTCRHVVDGESGLSEREVHVDFWDGLHETGTVVRSHRSLDYALIVVPRRRLPAAPIGDALGLREAETVYVVGSPGGLANSVSRGIVSASRRTCMTNVEYIQTDAAISPGNSGGPVVNEQGDLVGISTWTYRGAEAARAQGVAFAIPIDYVAGDVLAIHALGGEEACRRVYCRHCGWLHAGDPRYCESCGAMFVEKLLGDAR